MWKNQTAIASHLLFCENPNWHHSNYKNKPETNKRKNTFPNEQKKKKSMYKGAEVDLSGKKQMEFRKLVRDTTQLSIYSH